MGATHKVTAKQTACSFVSAQLHIHQLLTSSNTEAFPTRYQGELSGHTAFPHPNKILPGAAHRGSAQSPPAHGRKATSHCMQKWQKPPVRPFIFPGQYPMAKLKINISLASSTTQPTLDNSCRGLASCWRYNPSVERAIFSRRHPGRYRKGGKKGKKMSLAQIFLIPGYHLHDQKQRRPTPLQGKELRRQPSPRGFLSHTSAHSRAGLPACGPALGALCQDADNRKGTKSKGRARSRDRSLYQCLAAPLGWT